MIRWAVVLMAVFAVLGAGGTVRSQDNTCDPGEAPDIIVGDIPSARVWSTQDGITPFSIGTTSCNIGSCWADWIPVTPQHPVIAQNMFRLKDGRLEQIGQSWVKHGFSAQPGLFCSQECLEGDIEHLGVLCSDTYSAFLNGQQVQLGPKWEINAATGDYPFPATDLGLTGSVLYKRLQVHNDDLIAALNPGAKYFVEGQYVHPDDETRFNDASYRRVEIIELAGGFFDIELLETTVAGFPAMYAWDADDPGVLISTIEVPGDGRFTVGARATSLGGGLWHYEYAVHNFTSHRSAGSFSVQLPFGVNLSNVGFHDVDYHSGEPWDGTDWSSGSTENGIQWATTPYSSNPEANALRWGTLYNFRFEADVPPSLGTVTLGLFRPPGPGEPDSMSIGTVAPRICDNDGVCDAGEDCDNCPVDCSDQNGGGGCCGDGTCDPGETSCNCLLDCGPPASTVELVCFDALDEDCDGQTDCEDPDCCDDVSCQGVDQDNDTFAQCDCNDKDETIWVKPSESRRLLFDSPFFMRWNPPIVPGAASLSYEVLRSNNPLNFVTSITCLADLDVSDTLAQDHGTPDSGRAFYYLVRAVNDCPAGEGSAGRDSSNVVRATGTCP